MVPSDTRFLIGEIRLSPPCGRGRRARQREAGEGNVIAGFNLASTAIHSKHRRPQSCPNRLAAFLNISRSSVVRNHQNPRGRFVRAHLRRNFANPRDYFNVSDYQEEMDRLRRKQMRLADLQLNLPFTLSSGLKRGKLHDANEPISMKINVEIDHSDVDGDYGPVDGLCLVCKRCGYEVKVAGTREDSARRGAVLLREECPMNENNFYDVGHWQ
jgi:hypothetical protein